MLVHSAGAPLPTTTSLNKEIKKKTRDKSPIAKRQLAQAGKDPGKAQAFGDCSQTHAPPKIFFPTIRAQIRGRISTSLCDRQVLAEHGQTPVVHRRLNNCRHGQKPVRKSIEPATGTRRGALPSP